MLPIRMSSPASEQSRQARFSRSARRTWFRLAGIVSVLCCLGWGWTASRLRAQDAVTPAQGKEAAPKDPAAAPPAEGAASATTAQAAAKAAKEDPAVPPGEKAPPGYGNRALEGATPATTPAGKVPPPPPADLVPCKVQIRVGFGTDPYLTAKERESFLADLAEHANRWLGDTWQVEIVTEPQLSPGASFLLERLTLPEFQLRYAPHLAGEDKLFLLTLETQGAGYLLAAREWDAATQQLGPMQSQTTYIRSALAATAFQIMHDLYRPVVRIEKVVKNDAKSDKKGDDAVQLRALAGDIRSPDPSWAPLRTGAVFEGYTRVLDKKKAVQRIQQVPWSYITVGKVERGVADCSVLSPLGKPFVGQRRRSEQVGLEIRRQYPETELTLRTRGLNSRPQTGLEVEVLREVKGKRELVFKTLSNRLGAVTIPVDLQAENPRVWLVVRSSSVPLAMLPYIPGIHPTDQLQLPDDSLRLKVEGELTLLQADIVDTVARREVMRATARAQKKTNNLQKVEQLIAELDSLPTGESFSLQLAGLRVSSTAQAKARRDRVAETRINKLCAETNDLIAKHLDAEKLRATREELSDIRMVIAEEVNNKKKIQDAINDGSDNPRRRNPTK